ncbi:DUF6221 family protein [Marinitenerispora sediminis]|uniref:Uncharacterized protein n=1 Tax=Marinitenerispora sediminis TaxID=1931232 RepID=A0A368T9K4_9ACTN|nr:DUF6221 family protein [Marinitenerispora sediminis]RCV55163.1 hypothetical protein DEF28_06555 [Marinitenerispora sediminis]RCV61249.1 hypothetical protein DEF24_04725 [Marinitenerispora sediminis]RCV61520.1 hypothetical protein DEF23_02040 [Marinitenerispora sediminis]
MTTMAIAAFVRARLDEDADVARAASHSVSDAYRPAAFPEMEPRLPGERWQWVAPSGAPLPLEDPESWSLGRTGHPPGRAPRRDWTRYRGREQWVRARIPEEGPLHLRSREEYPHRADSGWSPHWILAAGPVTFGAAAHIARRAPGRALAEVESGRRMLDHAVDLLRESEDSSLRADPVMSVIAERGAQWADRVVRCLAAPYADHPDYREEWRP